MPRVIVRFGPHLRQIVNDKYDETNGCVSSEDSSAKDAVAAAAGHGGCWVLIDNGDNGDGRQRQRRLPSQQFKLIRDVLSYLKELFRLEYKKEDMILTMDGAIILSQESIEFLQNGDELILDVNEIINRQQSFSDVLGSPASGKTEKEKTKKKHRSSSRKRRRSSSSEDVVVVSPPLLSEAANVFRGVKLGYRLKVEAVVTWKKSLKEIENKPQNGYRRYILGSYIGLKTVEGLDYLVIKSKDAGLVVMEWKEILSIRTLHKNQETLIYEAGGGPSGLAEPPTSVAVSATAVPQGVPHGMPNGMPHGMPQWVLDNGGVEEWMRMDADRRRDSLRRQMDFYFSDENFNHDRFLQHLVKQYNDKGVPLERIAKFNKMMSLSSDLLFVEDSIQNGGEYFEYDKKFKTVRRRQPTVTEGEPSLTEPTDSTILVEPTGLVGPVTPVSAVEPKLVEPKLVEPSRTDYSKMIVPHRCAVVRVSAGVKSSSSSSGLGLADVLRRLSSEKESNIMGEGCLVSTCCNPLLDEEKVCGREVGGKE